MRLAPFVAGVALALSVPACGADPPPPPSAPTAAHVPYVVRVEAAPPAGMHARYVLHVRTACGAPACPAAAGVHLYARRFDCATSGSCASTSLLEWLGTTDAEGALPVEMAPMSDARRFDLFAPTGTGAWGEARPAVPEGTTGLTALGTARPPAL